MRLQTATGLQAAMAPYAVTGLNILAADCDGNIAMTHAAWLPRRAGFSVEDMVINADQANAAWADRLSSLHLPGTLNPPDGLIASTNNKPQAAPPVSYFFNGEERQQRLRGLTLAAGQMTVETLKHLQTDVQSDNARHMAGLIANWIRQHAIKPAHLDVAQKLASWDGRYTADSQHALLFEGLISALRRQLAGSQPRHAAWWVIQEWAYISNFLLEDIYQLTAPEQTRIMSKSLNVAIKLSQRHGTWGQVHRLSPRHVLSGLPWIGKRWFPSVDLPASGSRETLMKNAHGWIEKPQPSTYGAQARQICDLSDPDHNFFVLLGGQDENASSPHAVDQVKLWADSRYIQMPLTQGEVDKAFDRVWIFES
jgi:penicillin amidase